MLALPAVTGSFFVIEIEPGVHAEIFKLNDNFDRPSSTRPIYLFNDTNFGSEDNSAIHKGPESNFNTGLAYLVDDKCGPKNLKAARVWLKRAADKNHEQATKKLNEVNDQIKNDIGAATNFPLNGPSEIVLQYLGDD